MVDNLNDPFDLKELREFFGLSILHRPHGFTTCIAIAQLLQNLYDNMIASGSGELDHSALLTHLESIQSQ